MTKQSKEIGLADASSIIRVLNRLGAKVRLCNETIYFKLRNKKFIDDLESLTNTYNPLTAMHLHNCGEGKDCTINNFYFLDVKINPKIHTEAAHALYEFLNKYSKR